jgi:UDP-N-acetyl-D-galactosamine dehydrogenase
MKKKIAIIGLGYVGLPLAVEFAKKFTVTGYDINKEHVQLLRLGIDHNKQHQKKKLLNCNLTFTDRIDEKPSKYPFIIITVPTPVNAHKQPDLSHVESATINAAKLIQKNSIIIYESTTYPGCTEEVCIPLLEKYSKLKYNKDFFVAYSPERVNPGDTVNTLNSITKIVGSNNPKITLAVTKLYKIICKTIYPVQSLQIAEAAKVIENIQRDINIALVNELSVLFHKMNIPTDEVLKAASTKWNFHYYKPGLVGGHCIGVDPYYLSYKAEQYNYFPELLLSGRRFNENMGRYIATQVIKLLIQNNINFSKAKIAILGFAFKENIADFRNTKVIQIFNELQNYNLDITIFDSQVSKNEVQKEHNLAIYDLKKNKKNKFDCLIIAVPHKEFIQPLQYYNHFFKNIKNKIIVDVKNIFHRKDLNQQKFKYFKL